MIPAASPPILPVLTHLMDASKVIALFRASTRLIRITGGLGRDDRPTCNNKGNYARLF